MLHRASRVATLSIFRAYRRQYPGGNNSVLLSLVFPSRLRPSPNLRRVGSRIALFEACSAFIHISVCTVAKLLYAALFLRSASVHVAPSMTRPGCYQPKRQLLGGLRIPPGKRAFPRRTEKGGLGACVAENFQQRRIFSRRGLVRGFPPGSPWGSNGREMTGVRTDADPFPGIQRRRGHAAAARHACVAARGPSCVPDPGSGPQP